MEAILHYKKGKTRGAVAIHTNNDSISDEELIESAKKKIDVLPRNLALTGEEKWRVQRGLL